MSEKNLGEIAFARAKKMVELSSDKLIDNIAHYRKSIREKAIGKLIKPLDSSSTEDMLVFKSIPLYLSQIGDFDAAISFLVTVIKNGHYIDMQVFSEVYEASLSSLDDEEVMADFEYVELLKRKVDFLINATKGISAYKEDPDFLLLLGKDFERKGELEKAIRCYDTLIGVGDQRGYLYAGLAYKTIGQTSFAVMLFQQGFDIYNDKIFLENIIIAYCEAGNIDEAKKCYLKMLGNIYDKFGLPTQGVDLPFIIYSFRIENDEDLKNFENLMVGYLSENQLLSSDPLLKLSIIANDYIEHSLADIEKRFSFLNTLGENETSEQREEYKQLINRRLYLMQVHLTVLKEEKYLYDHLVDLEKLAFSRNEEEVEILSLYFDDNFSPFVKGDLNLGKEGKNNDLDMSLKFGMKVNNILPIYDAMAMYISTICRIFMHGKNYRVFAKKLFPLLSRCYQEVDEVDISEILISESIIKEEADSIDSLNTLHFNKYIEFVKYIDKKYGKFIRVTLQSQARDSIDITPKFYPEVLKHNSELAAFFFIEKIVSGNFPEDITSDNFGDFCLEYRFEELNEEVSFIFALFIYDLSFDMAIDFIVNSEFLINNVFALYYLLESIINQPTKSEIKALLKDLNKLFQEQYGKRGVLAHIRNFIVKKFVNLNSTDLEMEYCRLCSGDLAILQNKGPELIIENFVLAEQNGTTNEATLQLADLSLANAFYAKALDRYEIVFLSDQNIANLSKVITTAIAIGDFEKAYKYINLGSRRKFRMDYYYFAYHLWKGDFTVAYGYFAELIQTGQPLLDAPEGTLNYLSQISGNISNSNLKIDLDTLKLKYFASYSLGKLDQYYEYGSLTENIFHQVFSTFSILYSVPLEDLPKFVGDTLYCTYGKTIYMIEDVGLESIETIDDALKVIDVFALNMYKQFSSGLSAITDFESYRKVLSQMNEFVSIVVMFLNSVEGAEDIAITWKHRLTFPEYKGAQIFPEILLNTRFIN